MYISVFGKRLSRKSNNVVVFPFAFHIAVQQLFTHSGYACCYMILEATGKERILSFEGGSSRSHCVQSCFGKGFGPAVRQTAK
jgi:hypothetical protein